MVLRFLCDNCSIFNELDFYQTQKIYFQEILNVGAFFYIIK